MGNKGYEKGKHFQARCIEHATKGVQMTTMLLACATIYRKFAAIPLVFLGIGIQRAWASLLFDSSIFPLMDAPIYAAGVACTALVNFVVAFFATRITPLFKHVTFIACAVLGAAVGSLCIVADTYVFHSIILSYLGSILSLSATGITMLLWCEFFSSLNPTRVALIYSLAISFGAVISYFMSDMSTDVLWPLVIIMPLFNAVWAVDSIHRVNETPKTSEAPSKPVVSYPVKPVVLMATVSFASGFIGIVNKGGNLESLIGTCAIPLIIIAVIFSGSSKVQLNTIYRLAMPAITIAMIALLPTHELTNIVAVILFDGGDTALAIMTMIIFSNISYRYGMNVLRLNGIERGVRYTAFTCGWLLQSLFALTLESSFFSNAKIIVAAGTILVFSIMFLSNHDLFSSWGIRLIDDSNTTSEPENSALRVIVCENLSKSHQLTAREQEVLLLLAQKKTPFEIEKSLVIAQGTLKAHINHIYSKLEIHSRNELYSLLQCEEIRYINSLSRLK